MKTIKPYSKEWDELICSEGYFGSYRHLFDKQNILKEEEDWHRITLNLIDKIRAGMRIRIYVMPVRSSKLFYREYEIASEAYESNLKTKLKELW